MANKHKNLKELFVDIANAIRTKGNTSDKIIADDFPTAILNIPIPIPKPTTESFYTKVIVPEAGVGVEGVFLTNNDFIKKHQKDAGFFALVLPVRQISEIKYILLAYGGNKTFSTFGGNYKGITISASSASNTMFRLQTGALSGTPEGYNGCLLTNASGKLFCYTGGNQKVKAGEYHVFMGVL